MPNCSLCGVGCLHPPGNLILELWPCTYTPATGFALQMGFSRSVLTDVAHPHNCVLYFGRGVSRGGWGCRSKPPSREGRELMEEEGLGVRVLRNDHEGCRSHRRQGLSVVTPSFLETQ